MDINVGGSFKKGLNHKVNVNGEWKQAQKIWVNVNGVWKEHWEFWSNEMLIGQRTNISNKPIGYNRFLNVGELTPNTIENTRVQFIGRNESGLVGVGMSGLLPNSTIDIEFQGKGKWTFKRPSPTSAVFNIVSDSEGFTRMLLLNVGQRVKLGITAYD